MTEIDNELIKEDKEYNDDILSELREHKRDTKKAGDPVGEREDVGWKGGREGERKRVSARERQERARARERTRARDREKERDRKELMTMIQSPIEPTPHLSFPKCTIKLDQTNALLKHLPDNDYLPSSNRYAIFKQSVRCEESIANFYF